MNIFEETQRIPAYLWCDKGTEFYNNVFKTFLNDNSIKLYSTENEQKAVIIERFNRTLKNKMWKYFTAIGKQEWSNKLLQKLIHEYNNKVHSSIEVTPYEASQNPKLIKEINQENNNANDDLMGKKPKFKIGQRVRIYKYKHHFEKGFTHSWTKEIFIITKIYYTQPITYGISSLDGESIIGRWYENQLIKSDF